MGLSFIFVVLIDSCSLYVDIPPNESFIINQLLLTTNNQENCVYHDIPVVVGEEIRIPCSIPNQGIEILSCYESDKGVEWKKKKSYCSMIMNRDRIIE